MKRFFSIFILSQALPALASECQPPSQGHLEARVKESFHGKLGETELKEWMIHPSNQEIRQSLKELDRRIKFSPQRLDRELLQAETQVKFEQAVLNTGRVSVMDNFPAIGAQSKISGSTGALTLEMRNLAKDELDIFPKEILDKLEPKVKINYHFPYDKFEYLLTYAGKEQPMGKALLNVQKDMEDACERRMIQNGEYRRWYDKSNGGGSSGSGKGEASSQ